MGRWEMGRGQYLIIWEHLPLVDFGRLSPLQVMTSFTWLDLYIYCIVMISGIQLGNRRFKSQLKDETHFYMKISKEDASIQIVNKDFVPVKGYNYRIVHNMEAASAHHDGSSLFVDEEFTVDPREQFPNEQVIVKRLSNMYGITNLPHFFQLDRRPVSLEDNEGAPSCIRELALFSTAHYKSLFITQDFQQSGKYILTANIDGRFEVISVDDRIPLYKDTMEPVWGYSFNSPWELILLKAWAKIVGGYNYVMEARSFEFVETFSYSTWKYFNLAKESKKFLQYYYESSKFKNGKIILKTKKDEIVVRSGLTANSVSYQLIAIHEETVNNNDKYDKKQRRFVLTIRSTDLTKFTEGDLSMYAPSARHYLTEGLTLDHDTLMTDREFLGLFSSAHITSTRHEDFYSGYKILDIERYERKAQYFEFMTAKEGFFDFSIQQFSQNQGVEGGEQSKIYMEQSNIKESKMNESKLPRGSRLSRGNQNRFLRLKYILVKDNAFNSQEEVNTYKSEISNQEDTGSKIRELRGSDNGFPVPRFTSQEIQYFKGYSKGSTHFVKLDAGRHILRFKSENVDFDAKYAINWTCSHKIDMIAADLSMEEEVDLLHDSMVSVMYRYPHFNYGKEQNTEMLTIADSFEEIGYGFFSIKCSTTCNRSIIVEVDPGRLHNEGYRLKGKYKCHSDSNKKFSVKVESGEYDAIVFKKLKDAREYIWPSQAFTIYKKEFKEPRASFNGP